MDSNDAIKIATEFLKAKRIAFSEPVHAVQLSDDAIEVVFTAPGALDPDLVVDPPEVRVSVSLRTQLAELLPDM
jgi:hypothetical protein